MNVYCAKEFGAQNSKPVFEAFINGVRTNNDSIVYDHRDADVIVIWSYLFSGRMAPNRELYNYAKENNIPVVVLEIGAIKRNETWKVGLNGINRAATWCPPFDKDRAKRLGLELKPWKTDGQFVTICTQRPDSQQWEGKPSVELYVRECIDVIRAQLGAEQEIVIRPHPRDMITVWSFLEGMPNVYFNDPSRVANTYDSFDHLEIFKRSKLIFNYSSGPSIQSVLEGIPTYCSEESLAWDVSIQDYLKLSNPPKQDRQDWLNEIAHTEWTLEEIEKGTPWKYLRLQLK